MSTLPPAPEREGAIGSLRPVVRGYVPLLAIVAAIWGASYLFIKVAVDEVEPAAMMFFRLVLAVAVLVPVLMWRAGARQAVSDVRATGGRVFAVGFLNAAIPFTLIAWGEQHIDSGIAAIANATVPIFVILLALRFNPSERVRGVRLAGILVGFLGVGVLVGLHPEGGWLAVAGTLAVVLASLCYAGANHFVQYNYSRTSPLVIATASAATGAIILLPFALFQLPAEMPSWEAVASIVALGVLRHRRRPPLLLPPAQPLRRRPGVARDLPPPAHGARLRRRDPRRDRDAERGARPRAHPRRRRARVGRRAPAAPTSCRGRGRGADLRSASFLTRLTALATMANTVS